MPHQRLSRRGALAPIPVPSELPAPHGATLRTLVDMLLLMLPRRCLHLRVCTEKKKSVCHACMHKKKSGMVFPLRTSPPSGSTALAHACCMLLSKVAKCLRLLLTWWLSAMLSTAPSESVASASSGRTKEWGG